MEQTTGKCTERHLCQRFQVTSSQLQKLQSTEISFFYGHRQCLKSRMVIHDHLHGWGDQPGK